MIEHTLNMGDVITSQRKARYSCFGLGSCIGLFVQDRLTGLSGGAHILLPENEQGPDRVKFYSVVEALNEILNQFKSQGSDLSALRAKVTGGASVIGININTGIRNSESIIHQLKSRRIYIAAMDLGGEQSRTARFESHTGVLTVSKSSLKECKVY